MQDNQENARRTKLVPKEQLERRKGIVHDVLLPIAQEAKPIAEAAAATLLTQKLSGGKNPPPPSGDEKG